MHDEIEWPENETTPDLGRLCIGIGILITLALGFMLVAIAWAARGVG